MKKLDTTKSQPVAKAQLEKLLRETVEWIAGKCWEQNLESYIKKINTVLSSGSQLNVSSARLFSNEEIQELVSTISPLKHLEMENEIREILIGAVCDLGVSPTIFDPQKS